MQLFPHFTRENTLLPCGKQKGRLILTNLTDKKLQGQKQKGIQSFSAVLHWQDAHRWVKEREREGESQESPVCAFACLLEGNSQDPGKLPPKASPVEQEKLSINRQPAVKSCNKYKYKENTGQTAPDRKDMLQPRTTIYFFSHVNHHKWLSCVLRFN